MARPRAHIRAARMAAVSILTLAAALLAVWAAPRVSDAVATWMSTPPVQSVTLGVPGGLPVSGAAGVLPDAAGGRSAAADGQAATAPGAAQAAPVASAPMDAGMRFTMLGVTCTPPKRRGPVTVLLRTSEDGATWSRWYAVALELAADGGGSPEAYTEAIWTGAGRYVEVAARRGGARGAVPARLGDVRVVAINSTEDSSRTAALVGVLRRAAVAVAGFRFAPAAAAMTDKPEIVTRQQWGANESWRSGSPSYAPVRMAIIHHTDSGNSYSRGQAPAIVRGVYYYHSRSLHWSDVGYNFLVDRYGTIYEGRYGGVTRGVIGAQTLGFNTGSTGISVIGTFTKVAPPASAIDGVERLLAWKLDLDHLDPSGTASLVCGYGEKYKTGQTVKFPVIAGHRDANYTDCPGTRFYALLPSVRKAVYGLGGPKIFDFRCDSAGISPNGDGVGDTVTVGFTLSEPASWSIEIRSDEGKVVRHLSGDGTGGGTTWDGRDDDGKTVPDGVYSLRVTASSASGEARPAETTITVDTTPPQISGASVAPDPFSPNGDGQNDAAVVSFDPGEKGTARLSVIDASGTVLRRATGWTDVAAGVQTLSWDGRVGTGGTLKPADEGPALLLLEVRDVAGNADSLRRKVTVDRTLGAPGVTPAVISPNGDGTQDEVVMGFTLTRTATVTLTVEQAGQAVKTLRGGSLAAGKRSLTWDGSVNGGDKARDGQYVLRVTADGAVGTTSVTSTVGVDLTAPKLTVPATARARHGRTAGIAYTVNDAASPRVKVWATVTDAQGQTVATVACGWVKQGTRASFSWKPSTAGTYTVAFHALDKGGNHESGDAKTALRVR